jgi:hypothetical protein
MINRSIYLRPVIQACENLTQNFGWNLLDFSWEFNNGVSWRPHLPADLEGD